MILCLESQCRRHKKKETVERSESGSTDPSHTQDRLYLWYDHICQGFGESEELSCAFQLQSTVVLHIILDAVVNIRDLADVITPIFHAEISLQLTPALQHQF